MPTIILLLGLRKQEPELKQSFQHIQFWSVASILDAMFTRESDKIAIDGIVIACTEPFFDYIATHRNLLPGKVVVVNDRDTGILPDGIEWRRTAIEAVHAISRVGVLDLAEAL